jgi:SAM-dependent methyltransferase
MISQESQSCPLCGHPSHIVCESITGYQEGKTFSIYECEGCSCSYASPLHVDDGIYTHIYRDAEFVAGYNRYHRYAHEVLQQKSPLCYLSHQEEAYWAVAQQLRKRRQFKHDLKILEIGCGMGYLTYALVKDGFTATGIDLSRQAIAWAREHYGLYYTSRSLLTLRGEGKQYDAIVLTELIEHLSNVDHFIIEALALLARGGELILTTPNKSSFPGAEWDTELPPVHLWWFGEEAIELLAARHNCTVSFVDFREFYEANVRLKTPTIPLKDRTPLFTSEGKLIIRQQLRPIGSLRRILEQAGLVGIMRLVAATVGNKERWREKSGPVIAAVLHREDQG